MDDSKNFVLDDDQIIESNFAAEEKTTTKRQFNDTLLAQLMCPSPASLPQGTARRVYGVMSDTPMSRRTRLYQE